MKKVIFVTGLCFVLIVMGLGAASVERPTDARPATPIVAAGVGALGRIEPCSEVRHIHAPSVMESPVIAELKVSVGQRVVAGDVLAVLDSNARERADLEQARAESQLAEKSLAKVKACEKAGDIAAQQSLVEQTQQRLDLAERQLERVRKLMERQAMSQDDLDVRQSEVDVLHRELLENESRLAAIREVRPVDVEQAEADVARSRAVVQRAEADVAVTEVRSPISGEVLKINNRAGERIGSDGLLELGDTSSMHVVAEVHEADILRVKLNQRASILLREQKETLQGTVIEVGRLVGRKDVLSDDPVDDTDARVVEVRIRLDEADSQLVSGLSYARVEVRIDTETFLTQAGGDHGPDQLSGEKRPHGARDADSALPLIAPGSASGTGVAR
ncbi:MAG: HlyD family efflux transporter periplasmic adaptor subunit [Planctomycetota bacterium]